MRRDRIKDKELWERVKKTTKPLHSNKYSGFPTPGFVEQSVSVEPEYRLKPERIVRPYQPDPPFTFSDVPKSKLLDEPTRKKISKGKLGIEAKIDLHGMTQNEAYNRLFRFLEQAQMNEKRTVLVITGKGVRGEGILKNAVPRWLGEPAFRNITTGYHEASIAHGGSGALYVRVRRKRSDQI